MAYLQFVSIIFSTLQLNWKHACLVIECDHLLEPDSWQVAAKQQICLGFWKSYNALALCAAFGLQFRICETELYPRGINFCDYYNLASWNYWNL